jgi:hypothetical protein
MRIALYGKLSKKYRFKDPCRYFKPYKIFLFSKFYDLENLNIEDENKPKNWVGFAKTALKIPREITSLDQSILLKTLQMEDTLVNSENKYNAVLLLKLDKSGKCVDLEAYQAEEPDERKVRYCGTLEPVDYKQKEKIEAMLMPGSHAEGNFIVSEEALCNKTEFLEKLRKWTSDDPEMTSFSAVFSAALELEKAAKEDGKINEIADAIADIAFFGAGSIDSGDPGNTEPYAKKLGQYYYRSMYEYAYTYEYYKAYKQLLSDPKIQEKKNNLSIMSFGCGFKPDAVGLLRAAMESNFLKENTKYCGIDIENWKESNLDYYFDDDDFQLGDAKKMFLNIAKQGKPLPDVYFFPKCISELDAEAEKSKKTPLDELVQAMEKQINQDYFHVVVTVRRGGINEDGEKIVTSKDRASIIKLVKAMTSDGKKFRLCRQYENAVKEGKFDEIEKENLQTEDLKIDTPIYFYRVKDENKPNICTDTHYSEYSGTLEEKVRKILENIGEKKVDGTKLDISLIDTTKLNSEYFDNEWIKDGKVSDTLPLRGYVFLRRLGMKLAATEEGEWDEKVYKREQQSHFVYKSRMVARQEQLGYCILTFKRKDLPLEEDELLFEEEELPFQP